MSRGRLLQGRGRGQRRAGNPRRCEKGQMDRPRHDPGPHHHRRQRRHAPRGVHDGRRHRSLRKCLGLGGHRDVRGTYPNSRKRRRTNRGSLPGKSRWDEGRDHSHRGHGWPRSRDADEAGNHRRRRHGEGLRGPGDERRDYRSTWRSRDSDRRLDDARHDRLIEADSSVAELHVLVHVHSDVSAAVRQAPRDAGVHHSV